MFRKLIIAAVILLFSTAICFAEGPSFDCKKAKTCIEQFICGDEGLSKLDKEMSKAYKELLSKLNDADKKQVKKSQIEWIKENDEGCNKVKKINGAIIADAAISYLEDLYKSRIEELREWEQYVEGQNRTEVAPWQTKCWKRHWIGSMALPSQNTMPICRTFEQVLNTTCEPPEKLMCNWTLPIGEKRFKKLVWQPLDPKEYRGFIEEEVLGEVYSKKPDPEYKKMRWNSLNTDFKKAFEDNRLNIKMTVVDINNDGQMEQVVHYNWMPDCLARGVFSIMIPETKHVDWNSQSMVSELNSLNEGAVIMLYDGKAYMFEWEQIPGRVIGGDTCQFIYLKGGKEK